MSGAALALRHVAATNEHGGAEPAPAASPSLLRPRAAAHKPQSPASLGRFSLPPSVGDGFATRLPANRFVDRFGFLVTAEAAGAPPLSRAEAQLEGARAQKWEAMLRDWRAFELRHPRMAKRRVRKGIPNALRGRAWPIIAGADVLKAAHPGLYLECLAQTPARSDMMCIALDLPRTYPNHVLFTTAHIDAAPTTPGSALLPDGALAVGQRALRNVLRAFACHDPHVGYCQGMAFVAGLLITYMSEEDAFFMLVALTRGQRYGLAGMYSPGLPCFAEVMSVFSGLALRFMPRLCAHFEALGVDHAMYASQWFITLFTYSFPFDLVTRAWDCFLAEGWKAVYRVALAVLRSNADALLRMDFDELMPALKEMAHRVPCARIMAVALGIPVRGADVARRVREHNALHADAINARIAVALADAARKEAMLLDAERSFEAAGAGDDAGGASGAGGAGADAAGRGASDSEAAELSGEGSVTGRSGGGGRSLGGERLAAERARVEAAGAVAVAALLSPARPRARSLGLPALQSMLQYQQQQLQQIASQASGKYSGSRSRGVSDTEFQYDADATAAASSGEEGVVLGAAAALAAASRVPPAAGGGHLAHHHTRGVSGFRPPLARAHSAAPSAASLSELPAAAATAPLSSSTLLEPAHPAAAAAAAAAVGGGGGGGGAAGSAAGHRPGGVAAVQRAGSVGVNAAALANDVSGGAGSFVAARPPQGSAVTAASAPALLQHAAREQAAPAAAGAGPGGPLASSPAGADNPLWASASASVPAQQAPTNVFNAGSGGIAAGAAAARPAARRRSELAAHLQPLAPQSRLPQPAPGDATAAGAGSSGGGPSGAAAAAAAATVERRSLATATSLLAGAAGASPLLLPSSGAGGAAAAHSELAGLPPDDLGASRDDGGARGGLRSSSLQPQPQQQQQGGGGEGGGGTRAPVAAAPPAVALEPRFSQAAGVTSAAAAAAAMAAAVSSAQAARTQHRAGGAVGRSAALAPAGIGGSGSTSAQQRAAATRGSVGGGGGGGGSAAQQRPQPQLAVTAAREARDTQQQQQQQQHRRAASSSGLLQTATGAARAQTVHLAADAAARHDGAATTATARSPALAAGGGESRIPRRPKG